MQPVQPDVAAAEELHLYLDNDEPLYRMKLFVYKALARKKDSGRYDARLAPKAFLPLLTVAAKKYVREFGSPSDKWHTIFSPISRRHAALSLVEDFEDWYKVDYESPKKKG